MMPLQKLPSLTSTPLSLMRRSSTEVSASFDAVTPPTRLTRKITPESESSGMRCCWNFANVQLNAVPMSAWPPPLGKPPGWYAW